MRQYSDRINDPEQAHKANTCLKASKYNNFNTSADIMKDPASGSFTIVACKDFSWRGVLVILLVMLQFFIKNQGGGYFRSYLVGYDIVNKLLPRFFTVSLVNVVLIYFGSV